MGAEPKREFANRDRWLNFAMVLGPAAWLAHLNISYALVPESCLDGSKLKLHIATIVCVLIALSAAAIGWFIRGTMVDDGIPWKERTKWTANFVVILSISMAIVIVAQEIPNLILRSCD